MHQFCHYKWTLAPSWFGFISLKVKDSSSTAVPLKETLKCIQIQLSYPSNSKQIKTGDILRIDSCSVLNSTRRTTVQTEFGLE